MTSAVRSPLIQIPVTTETFAVFYTRLTTLIPANDTHLYVDASFLMWLTKIGSVSRQELIAWLKNNCSGRVHVPIWAAHEYVKHHVADTLATEFSKRTADLGDVVRNAYAFFRPYLDERHGKDAEDPAAIRADARAALQVLDRVTTAGRAWLKDYKKNAMETIAFINECTPETSSLYAELLNASEVGEIRFVGSVPPGFQDRGKGGRTKTDDNLPLAPAHSNRYGDLVFWKEILAHAKTQHAKCIVVITNDQKNDWHLGGGEQAEMDPSLTSMKRSWKPLPRAHPMLLMEAKLVSGAERLELLDSAYLAAFLRGYSEQDVKAFTDVAIVPDGPVQESEIQRKRRLSSERLWANSEAVEAEARSSGFMFADSPIVNGNATALRRALLESRGTLGAQGAAIIEACRANAERRGNILGVFSADLIKGMTHIDLAIVARELHDKVVDGVSGYHEAAADMASALPRLPPNTAGALYIGLLASMYLHRRTNAPRLPPASPIARLLFDYQAAVFGVNASSTLAKRLLDSATRPLYVPSADPLLIEAAFDIEPESASVDQLRSLVIAGVELIVPAQADEKLRLESVFGASTGIDAEALIRKACELYVLPEAQVRNTNAVGTLFNVSKYAGFKRPADIAIPKED